MKNKYSLNEEEIHLFQQSVAGAKRINQDTVLHSSRRKKTSYIAPERVQQEQIDASYYFSDEFQPNLDTEGPTRYVRGDTSHYELKKLRRGDYSPELFLDLHGLTQMQAKQEIGALIAACRREHVYCACIMHGHGKHILKQQTPLWLAQHPDIIAFHQAPKEWGGNAALLMLIELDEP
ncbi:endonuclease SmrB [Photorhabdus luminescens]|uniref:endonuclease SmrB n=1 Tax=Photorhabdus hainanensis TaxID=1004166 RepID=UPI000CF9FB15|nr:endonuclease SmrB [Photorhabdus hainanensis]MBS9434183.1 endonuclease SmrB [Photorhabdus hainanensis]PQQ28185.1 endonuclease SmrB [Photorhabdus luminescens]